jgi:GT2 family glycosyltransferase
MAYTNKDVTIVIPNWNGKALLEEYLPSVLSCTKGASIIIVDDCSSDDSVAFIQKNYPSITLVQKNIHEGFSGTINEGVAHAHTPLVLLLNTDIEPLPQYLDTVFPYFDKEETFAVGLKDNSREGGKSIYRGRGIASFQRGMYIHTRGEVNSNDTAWVSCGSGVFRREIWNKLGGLDTLFHPFYWEDIDISYRAVKAGYDIYFDPDSEVMHHHAKGAILTHSSPTLIKKVAFRNQLLFMWKNIGDRNLLLEHILYLPLHLFRPLLKGDTTFISGFFSAVSKLSQCMQSRSNIRSLWKIRDKEVISSVTHI